MDVPVPNVLADVHQKDVDLLLGPIVGPRKRRHAEALEPGGHVLAVPHAQLLVLGVPRPRVGRPLVQVQGDVDEPNLGQEILEARDLHVRPAELLRCLEEQLATLAESVVLGEGAVVGPREEVDFLELDVSAGVHVAV